MVAHAEDTTAALGGGAPSRGGSLGRLTSPRRFSLRQLLFASLLLIAIIPVGILALWTERSAYEKELAEVSERHLLIAQNLSHALERYSRDTISVFDKATLDMESGAVDNGLLALLQSMGFDHACIIDAGGKATASIVAASGDAPTQQFADMAALQQIAAAANGRTVFSDVRSMPDGTPRVFVVRQLENGMTAIGSLKTDYLVKLQKAIAFGEMGHSAIVDAKGQVLAHPRDAWRLERKDISAVLPVKRMMAGETGVATFYSPALNADMIAGFTTVPLTGWGVMVPQPIAELEAHANSVQRAALYVGFLGLMIAVILAWIVSRYLARPIEQIASVTQSVEAGDHAARVREFEGLTPAEIGALGSSVNQMLSEISRSSDRLRDKAEEAEAANKAKSRFLANMSHEFRTPLNAIIGYSEIMRDGLNGPLGGDGSYNEYVGTMHEAGVHILGMVNEILLLTRAEAGHLELHCSDVEVADVVKFAVAMIDRTAADAGLSVNTTVAANLPMLHTDDGKLRQILLNLVSNAAKFTDTGGSITIAADVHPDWAVVLRVQDNGIGIRPQDMPKVMKPFGQVQDAYSRNHGGTGLGLPLTQELASLMGGEFELRSSHGVGTEAIVKLPLRSPSAAATMHEGTAPQQ